MNTKEKLMQLLELCIENDLCFEHQPNINISVIKYNATAKPEPWDIYCKRWGDTTEKQVDEVIEIVKLYSKGLKK